MPDALVPEVERLTRAYEGVVDDVKPGERAVVAVINTAAMDRFKTVIDPLGMVAENYRKQPVVLWEHGKDPQRGRLPVGRNAWIKVERGKKRIVAKTIFRGDPFSDQLLGMYQDGTLTGFSIDGLPAPGQSGPPTAEEIRRRPELAECRCVYRSWELLEYSAVSVGGNPEALALAVSRGLWVPDGIRAGLPPLPPLPKLPKLVGRTFAQVQASVQARSLGLARKLSLEALQDARDLARGDI